MPGLSKVSEPFKSGSPQRDFQGGILLRMLRLRDGWGFSSSKPDRVGIFLQKFLYNSFQKFHL